jgi:ParB-like chromosome segregation protein Spo0J
VCSSDLTIREQGLNPHLIMSIEKTGILVPIKVHLYKQIEGYDYRLIDGLARFDAALVLGMANIPADVIEEELSDEQVMRKIIESNSTEHR